MMRNGGSMTSIHVHIGAVRLEESASRDSSRLRAEISEGILQALSEPPYPVQRATASLGSRIGEAIAMQLQERGLSPDGGSQWPAEER